MTWVLDLDGVVWRGEEPIAGSAGAIKRLQEVGRRVVYASNNAAYTTVGYVDKLARFGIDAERSDIVHGGHAVAQVVEPGSRVLVCAGPGVIEALEGCETIDVAMVEGRTPAVDVVVVGGRLDFQFEFLNRAVQGVLNGARLVAPSADPLYPVPEGFIIGGGSLATGVAYATGVEVIFAGKPFRPIADAVWDRVGKTPEILVGDQARTDGRLAQQLEAPFALVRSGVTSEEGRTDVETDVPIAFESADLAEVVDRIL